MVIVCNDNLTDDASPKFLLFSPGKGIVYTNDIFYSCRIYRDRPGPLQIVGGLKLFL